MSKPLILASRSPQRRKLLALLVSDFEVVNPEIDESPLSNELPETMTRRLAMEKARVVYRQRGPNVRVLGGDTTVVIADKILGKPTSPDEAASMLTKLSGDTHTVFSSVALCTSQGCQSLLCQTKVTFRMLCHEEIYRYCLTEDPYDKAGGYGIQSGAGGFVNRLSGSYSGVIGLPLWETHQLLFVET
ncbi:MAG: Maf family protein [Gammaproteobacteria bacterium]|nr:Maf family protein [Gammaproteobacteria bacterium]MCY4217670.1 Maf family protein [Gammaproteobacteria bacterium]MCY4275838.1 Maf family protein [Gammaproteobacteria bacterium]